jgi:aconitate hydratase
MPGKTLTRKLIDAHLADGDPTPGEEIALRIDQTLTQDATGTLIMQELEAIGLDRARTDVSGQYVDHNLLQADERNAEDHEFLRSAARRYGLWFSKPGNGVSHPTPRVSQFSLIMFRRRPRLRGRPGFLAGWPAQGMDPEIWRR